MLQYNTFIEIPRLHSISVPILGYMAPKYNCDLMKIICPTLQFTYLFFTCLHFYSYHVRTFTPSFYFKSQ